MEPPSVYVYSLQYPEGQHTIRAIFGYYFNEPVREPAHFPQVNQQDIGQVFANSNVPASNVPALDGLIVPNTAAPVFAPAPPLPNAAAITQGLAALSEPDKYRLIELMGQIAGPMGVARLHDFAEASGVALPRNPPVPTAGNTQKYVSVLFEDGIDFVPDHTLTREEVLREARRTRERAPANATEVDMDFLQSVLRGFRVERIALEGLE